MEPPHKLLVGDGPPFGDSGMGQSPPSWATANSIVDCPPSRRTGLPLTVKTASRHDPVVEGCLFDYRTD